MLLKLFIPTWKFFDQLGTVSKLYYRVGEGSWTLALEKPQRSFFNLFYNPEGNLYLASVSLVDRLVFAVGSKTTLSPEQIEQLESYSLVQNLVEVILRSKKEKVGQSFQFKIQVQNEDQTAQDFLVSKELVL